MHDLVVVGGGPAGTSCARAAALRGLDVLLIDKDLFPRDKLCAGGLTQRVAGLLDFDIDPVVERRFSGGRVYSSSGACLEIKRDDYSGYLVKRSVFDNYLLEKAKEVGVEVVVGTKALAIEQLRSGIRVLTRGDSYKAHLLIGADGVNGIVAKHVGIRARWKPETVALCISADISVDEEDVIRCMSMSDTEDSIALDLYFGLVEMGYGWCFPKRNELNIGIGCRIDRAANLRNQWKAFVRGLEEQKDLKLDLSRQSAFRVPYGPSKMNYVARRTMLVGDAAGLVSPISGEGIFYAIKSGHLAARVACEAAEKKNPYHVREYGDLLRKTILKELSAANYLAKMLYKSKRNMELLLQIAQEDPIMREHLIDIMAGTRPLQQIKRNIMKRMTTNHPLKAFKLRF
ncbi:MAG: geranylgeranyl reductase family protein [Candidatus Thorarchaeota archaeon]|jgi:geranylgeranyl reductase family protein